jgi:two-component system cell cycle response regulator DivK
MTGDKEKALNAGCIGYIEKPINPDTFIKEIKVYFKDDHEGE